MTGDLSSVGEPRWQPKVQAFPVSNGCKFTTQWHSLHSWIEYSIKADAAFCQACHLFGSYHMEEAFAVKVVHEWKKLGDKCKKHEASTAHKSSIEKCE